ncbi:glycosyltransferase family 4 protein [Synechococcus sp. Cruz-9H2]|uniref:glycosyltransferase family 4 protein n=1 Tax=unclassified Synechococcus TaxID=2626047 RepID=UPI0020CDD8C6|nr:MULTISPECIES: glycosyltransferase family 4 protein [unclassified Synechococcus]MCP9820640.1 glycosyltransferase family 4 protein [Synechococcus sp. Cruz-9H2]MCP9844850.1 glycosyltransferase family 4 protein [Synechococcus sp. Edmonson 11F2]MCP9856972.1 glycosyltransferase family 4 protein [Synechococcus sp. Cruz-9C9]MCP9864258.1 glycosyltransferase family 4 protein [Synechococcus sp. Cruz-7E5]MCP9871527.1 glycosyltransferase family 4 protein [Synechococcus sp. Cruz-7B9]
MSPALSRYLLCNGDANDLATWSSTPYFLLQAGQRSGLLAGGLALQPERLRRRRRLWNLAQWLRCGRPGGFQYSRSFTRVLLAEAQLPPDQPLALLSHFPLLPPCPWPEAWRVEFYIDATTRQVLDDYGSGSRIAPAFQRQVLERERQAYQAAGSVIAMSQWAADSVISDYGIYPAKVDVVPGGANLDETQLALHSPVATPPFPSLEHPLRLGFLGKDWQRKGGPFLLEVCEALAAKGLPAVVRAIGPQLDALPRHPALQPLGFINKQAETRRFAEELRSWHFGTLFSSAEAFGISNRECLRLGIPVLAHAVGGIPSTLADGGCGQLFTPHPSAAEVAAWVAKRLTPYEGYLNWRAALALRWREFTWEAAVEQLEGILC